METADPIAPVQEIWLDSFLKSIVRSLAAAQQVLRDQHIADIESHWEKVPAQGAETRRAKLLRLEIEPDGTQKIPAAALDVPTAALTQNNSLVLDTMSMEIDCTLTQFQAVADTGRIGIRFDKSGAGGSPVRLTLQFKTSDPPEGVARISDVAVRRLT